MKSYKCIVNLNAIGIEFNELTTRVYD